MSASSYIYSASLGKFLESFEFQDTDPMLFVFFPPSSPLSSLYSSLSHVDSSDFKSPEMFAVSSLGLPATLFG